MDKSGRRVGDTMPTKEELLEAIRECQEKELTYNTCEKLATFYTLLNYLYPTEDRGYSFLNEKDIFPIYNGSEFKKAIAGKDIEKVVDVLDEHMNVVKILYPKEYKAVIQMIMEG